MDAGWASDPWGGHQWRYWDGGQWTDQVADDGLTAADPPPSEVPSPRVHPQGAGTDGELVLPDGRIALSCFRCGAGAAHTPSDSQSVCGVCGAGQLIRKCRRCRGDAQPIHLTPDLVGKRLKWMGCYTCGRVPPRKWDMATFAELSVAPGWKDVYDRVGLAPANAESDPSRRQIDGVVVEATGMQGIAVGECGLMFFRHFAVVLIGDASPPLTVAYEDISTLRFAGRGEVVSTQGGGWMGGGFGLRGAISGALMASALNALTTRTESRNETIVNLAWRGGELVLLCTSFLPQQAARLLEPVVQRVREDTASQQLPPPVSQPAAQPTPPPDLVDQLAHLASLHEAGALTDEEYAAAKSKLLAGPTS